jgi:capsular polysaccharide biosynthesis protein
MIGNDRSDYSEVEIDLKELINMLKRKSVFIIIFVIIITSIVAIVNYYSKYVYAGNITIRIPANVIKYIIEENDNSYDGYVSQVEVMKIMEEVRTLNKDKLPKLLNVDRSLIDEFVGYKIKAPKEEMNNVIIVIEAHDKAVINDISVGIIKFLNKNNFVKKRINNEITGLKSQAQILNNSIEELQMKKRLMNERPDKGMNYNFGDIVSRISSLKVKLDYIEMSIPNIVGFEIVAGPVVYGGPIRPKKFMNVIMSCIVALFFAVIIGLIIEWKKMTWPANSN